MPTDARAQMTVSASTTLLMALRAAYAHRANFVADIVAPRVWSRLLTSRKDEEHAES